MNWLVNFYFREGPGIQKTAPQPEGLRLLAFVLWREWWELLKLNLLFIAFSLPLVTLPAAWFATVSITVMMIEDRNVYLLRDFLAAFRSRFMLTGVIGTLLLGAGALSGLAISTYVEAARDNLVFAAPLAVAVVVAAALPLFGVHLFTALAMGRNRPLGDLVKASAIGLLVRPLPGLLALVFVAMLWLVHIAFYPASVFLPVLVNFSLGALVTSFAVIKGVQLGFSHLAANTLHETTRSSDTQSA